MTTKRSIKWGLVAAAAAFAAVAAMPGCELLVDFDRSKIPVEGGDFDGTTSEVDGTASESSLSDDGGSGEGSAEGSADAPSEGASEGAGPDTGPDAPVESGAGDGAVETGDDGG